MSGVVVFGANPVSRFPLLGVLNPGEVLSIREAWQTGSPITVGNGLFGSGQVHSYLISCGTLAVRIGSLRIAGRLK